jgi:hypothetical protein
MLTGTLTPVGRRMSSAEINVIQISALEGKQMTNSNLRCENMAHRKPKGRVKSGKIRQYMASAGG